MTLRYANIDISLHQVQFCWSLLVKIVPTANTWWPQEVQL